MSLHRPWGVTRGGVVYVECACGWVVRLGSPYRGRATDARRLLAEHGAGRDRVPEGKTTG